MYWILILLVIIIGMLQPVQVGMNAEFSRHAAHPLHAAFLNMWIGALALLLIVMSSGVGLPSLSAMKNAPWWAYGGGLIGGTIVLVMLIAAPKLGAALLIITFFGGQVIASLLIDQYGLIGYAQKLMTPARVIGIGLVVTGMVVLAWSTTSRTSA